MHSHWYMVKYKFCMICFLVISLPSEFFSDDRNKCNYRPPDNYGDCGYSCLQQVSRWHFLELANDMPKCPTFTFYLSNGYYHSFPERFFSPVGRIQHFFLEITNVTFSHFPNSVGSLSPFANVIFEVSIVLQLVEVKVRRGWNWKAFEDLIADKGGTGIFDSYRLDMIHLAEDFSFVLRGSLRKVRFSGGNLKTLDDGVFKGLQSLSEVLLHDNQIEEVKRNFFPSPASVLTVLVLRGNRLKSLPLDMFIDMPSLKHVDLGQNPLLTLSETVFRSVIARAAVTVKANFHCNCDVRWLKYAVHKNKKGNFDEIFCETPIELRNRSIYSVTNEELVC